MTRASLLSIAFVLWGCTGNKQTEIVIAVATDLAIPFELSKLSLQVQRLDESRPPIDVTWDLEPSLAQSVTLPATIGLLPGKDLSKPVLITVQGLLGEPSQLVVKRQAQLLFARDRIVLLRMNLLKRCRPPMTCAERETCGENGCEPIEKDSSRLPDYSSDQEAKKSYLDARGASDALTDAPVDAPRSDVPLVFDGPKFDRSKDGPRSDKTKVPDGAKPVDKPVDKPKPGPEAKFIEGPKGKEAPVPPVCDWVAASTSGITSGVLKGVWVNSSGELWVIKASPCQSWVYKGSLWVSYNVGSCNQLNGLGGTGNELHTVGSNPSDGGFGYGSPAAFLWSGGWKPITVQSGTRGVFQAVWMQSTTFGFAVGQSYMPPGPLIYKYDGSSWSQTLGGGYELGYTTLNAVWGSATNDAWAVGGSGKVFTWDGAKWSPVTTPWSYSFSATWGTSKSDFYAVSYGSIVHYKSGGWTEEASGLAQTLNAMSGNSTSIFAVGSNGSIYQRSATAPPWVQVCTDFGTSLNAIWCATSSSCCYAAGGDSSAQPVIRKRSSCPAVP